MIAAGSADARGGVPRVGERGWWGAGLADAGVLEPGQLRR